MVEVSLEAPKASTGSGQDFRQHIEPTTASRRLLLVCPPFQELGISSLPIAQLSTFLRGHGVDCREAYLHFELGRILGVGRYRAMMTGIEGRNAEALFAEGYHGKMGDTALAEKLTRSVGPAEERARVLAAFEAVCLQRLELEQPEVVGMTTSFNQLMASLWLARLIKRWMPSVTTVLGGSACLSPMGQAVLCGYPEVDAVVSGFGELPLLALSRGRLNGRQVLHSQLPPDFHSAPIPDYQAYLTQAQPFQPEVQLNLTFQSSRGCWWGAKHRCHFCGLNGEQICFESKSTQRTLEEIRTLWERHQKNLLAADCIMSREHLRNLVPQLARFENGPRIFYELKANMTEQEVIALGRARMLGQLGIESLSTHLLSRMNKGTTAIRNLAVLKWCAERRVPVAWNQLCAVPGERVQDYDRQIELMRKIPHFPPPDLANPIKLDRFSTYFDNFRDFGWTAIRPHPTIRAFHPHLDEAELRQIAFQFEGQGGVSPDQYLDRFSAAVAEWRSLNQKGVGLFCDPEKGVVWNTPPTCRRYQFPAAVAHILDLTHQIVSIPRVMSQVGCNRALLSDMERHGLLYIEGEQILNLTIRTRFPSGTDSGGPM